jgi:predicted RecA/RadA family phage recombinase
MAYGPTTTARETNKQNGELIAFKMGAIKISKGTLVHTAIATGYVAVVVPIATDIYLGVAEESVDNSTGTAGAKSVRVYQEGVHSMVAAAADQTWVGKPVYWSTGGSGNSSTVVISAPGSNLDVIVGKCVGVVSATEVRVKINGYCNTAVA